VARVYVQDHRFRTHARSSPHYRPTLSYLFPSPAYSATENGAEAWVNSLTNDKNPSGKIIKTGE
jgi:hypothetical protein